MTVKNDFTKHVIAMLVCCTFLMFGNAKAQTANSEAKYKDGEEALWKQLGNELGKQRKLFNINKECLISTTFVKFIISKDGEVKVLDFYEAGGTPHAFQEMFTAVLKSTNNKWQPKQVNGKNVDSKPFILPFAYRLESACGTGLAPNTNYDALRTLLGFQFDPDKKTVVRAEYQLDCVLLRTVYMFSVI